MFKRVYATEQAPVDEFSDLFKAESIDKSCRITLDVPSALSQTSQNFPSFAAGKSPARKTPRKGLKRLPFEPREQRKKKKSDKRKALKEIKMYQRTGDLLIPKRPFRRLCVEIARKENAEIRFKKTAIDALQEAAEAYIVGMIEDSQLCCLHAKRVTLMQKDIELAKKIRK